MVRQAKGPAATPLVWLSRWRVNLAPVLFAATLPFVRPTGRSIAIGLPLVVTALALRIWARGHLERRRHLTSTGPYRWVRHPLYVGSYFLGLGFVCMTDIPALPVLFTLLFLIGYVPKALREEAFLRNRYGDAYARYVARVGAVWPRRGTAAPDAPGAAFAWRRVLRHGEWMTWLGAAAVLAIMCLRTDAGDRALLALVYRLSLTL